MPLKMLAGIVILVGLFVGMAYVYLLVCRVSTNRFVRGVVAGGFLLLLTVTLLSIELVARQKGVEGLADLFGQVVDTAFEWAKEQR